MQFSSLGHQFVFLTLEKVLHPLSPFSGVRNKIAAYDLVLTVSPSVMGDRGLPHWEEQPGRKG